MPRGSTLVSTAEMSEPTSRVPVVSTVAWTQSGTLHRLAAMASRAARTATLIWPRSWQVSMRMASAPPSSSPSICARYEARSSP